MKLKRILFNDTAKVVLKSFEETESDAEKNQFFEDLKEFAQHV